MSILGIGIDIVEIDRIQASLGKHGDKFAEKICHAEEFKLFKTHQFPARYLAKRFAAKEAFVKALGTGIVKGVSLPLIQVVNQLSGQPSILLHGRTQEFAAPFDISNIHLTISDEKRYAIAQVVIEKL